MRQNQYAALWRHLFWLLITALALELASLTLFGFASAQTVLTDAAGEEIIIEDTSRVITLGGDLTEIVFALGHEGNLAAVDDSSIYPVEGVAKLPKVGYVRALTAEGVLSLNPSLILASEDAGPPEVVEQLEAAGVPYYMVPGEDSVAGAKAKISTLGEIFGVEAKAEALVRQIDLDVAEAQLYVDAARAEARPSVLFIYARGAGTLLVSGTGTSADAIIALAGGENAVTDFADYKPLTAEAAVAAAPDILLFLSRGLESVGGYEGLRELPGLSATPAYDYERVVAFDDLYLLGFTPRLGEAILDLTRAFYPNVELAQQAEQ